MQSRNEAANVVRRELRRTTSRGEFGQLGQIAPIGGKRVHRSPPLRPQIVEEAFDRRRLNHLSSRRAGRDRG
jgi:hypothetical protein